MDGENRRLHHAGERRRTRHRRIRLLIVDPKARGLGLGQRLAGECVKFARERGYKKITLWTHSSILTAARHVYEKAGFTLTSSEPRHSWGKDVVAEFWDLDLSPSALP
ncbi:MAG: GNAT family N-acetyltransferase [Pseudolabrys sp.]